MKTRAFCLFLFPIHYCFGKEPDQILRWIGRMQKKNIVWLLPAWNRPSSLHVMPESFQNSWKKNIHRHNGSWVENPNDYLYMKLIERVRIAFTCNENESNLREYLHFAYTIMKRRQWIESSAGQLHTMHNINTLQYNLHTTSTVLLFWWQLLRFGFTCNCYSVDTMDIRICHT